VKVIGLGGIAVLADRMRVLRGEVVTELAESMPPRGPIEPIVVRPAPGDGNGYWSRTVRPLNLISDQGRRRPSLPRPARPKRARIFELNPHGCYVEPEWCDTCLFEAESFGAEGALVLDPAAGLGRIMQAARAAGYRAIGSDIVDRPGRYEGLPFSVCDFLKDSPARSAWSVVCDSPFDHIQEFVERALMIAVFKVAVIMPLRRLPAAHWLKRLPLETIYLLSPRPSMPPATCILAGGKPSNGVQDFIWLVFRKEMTATAPAMRWLHRNREASS
jgi:hypothetical protein